MYGIVVSSSDRQLRDNNIKEQKRGHLELIPLCVQKYVWTTSVLVVVVVLVMESGWPLSGEMADYYEYCMCSPFPCDRLLSHGKL